jgi:O-antigen biosynthesis protein
MISSNKMPGKRILFLDDHVPYPYLGVGYPRAKALLHALDREGFFVSFLPLECPYDEPSRFRSVLPPEVDVILGISPEQLSSFLSSRIIDYDLVFVSRPNNMRLFLSALGKLSMPTKSIPIIYDSEAIFAIREILRHTVEGLPLADSQQAELVDNEMRLARAATHVAAVSEDEAAMFRSVGCSSVSLLGDELRVLPTPMSHSGRKDLLFVGALDDDPSPNVDALLWFVDSVLPLVRRRLGEPIRLIVAGRCAAARVRALVGREVVLLGTVPDLWSVYDTARVFISPHRYAAGIPRKVLDAAAQGVPCVASDLIARQLRWSNGNELLCASTAETFARSVVQLYTGLDLWSDIRRNALHAIEQNYSEEIFRRQLADSLQRAWSCHEQCHS